MFLTHPWNTTWFAIPSLPAAIFSSFDRKPPSPANSSVQSRILLTQKNSPWLAAAWRGP